MRWKWILAAAAGVVVVLFIVAIVIVKSYDFNNLKPQITQIVKDVTGRELLLDGDLVLEIGLTPSITVSDVAFSNAPWGTRETLATVKKLNVSTAQVARSLPNSSSCPESVSPWLKSAMPGIPVWSRLSISVVPWELSCQSYLEP